MNGFEKVTFLKPACWLSALFVVGLSSALLAQSPPGAADLPPGYWPLAKSQVLIDKTRRVRLAPDLSRLGAGERVALAKLLEVGRIFQDLYERQQHPQAERARAALRELDRRLGAPQETQNLLTLYRRADGPIAELLDNTREAFLPVDPVQPGKNVYPWGIDKAEVEAWLGAHPEQRGAILGLRTVVRRAAAATLREDAARLQRYPALALLHPGLDQELARLAAAPDPKALYAIPYALAYADEMLRAFTLLNEAAQAVETDDREFAGYLRNRARDLISDDYESGDAAWVTGRFGNLNAEIGAYETYDDELFGNKAFFSASLLLERKADTAALREAMKGLQGLEDSLPYGRHKRIREDIPVAIYDVIADFGQARGGNTATILPNESYLARRYGRRIMIRSNILRNPDIFAQQKQMWAAVVALAHREELDLDGQFYDTLWHEIGHYLGIDRTSDGRDLGGALEEDADVLEEMKADLVALFVAESLQRQGYYDAGKVRGLYAAGIWRVLVNNQPRRDQPYETMMLMQWNFFMENGLLAFDRDTGTVAIRYDNYHQVVEKLLAKIFELQNQGDKQAADRFIAQYTGWDENLHGVIARKLRETARYRYTLYTYGTLDD
jgi:hypothetical protein